MSESKFTKGEWVVSSCDLNVTCNGYRIARAYSGSSIPYVQKAKTNAYLIAVSPEMYEEIYNDTVELKEFILTLKEHSNDWLFYSSKLATKEALLVKARGES